MSISGALGRAVGALLGSMLLMVARPVAWLVHRPTTRGEV